MVDLLTRKSWSSLFPRKPSASFSGGIQQRTAEWVQRYNTYVLDTNYFVKDPQALWLAPSDNSRFDIAEIKPPDFVDKDPAVLSIGPFNDDNYIAVYTSHQKPGEKNFAPSDPHHSSYDFTIGGKNAISFTLVNAEDGGDSDYHDTVVGVAVNYTYK
ncbi:uncharacterized protein LACBIDRAFT_312229 [Laccaria bicolor S238N-H82]|uniref:Predicted protein n=1 Tax=Laccaria bicolor (strain S238N-H82 / ATCC MYA-4686) TaxID=486041 RepID=B0DVR8_LACBS|nr:uncharacterized protein LACBIDRAFT_312229 [Laccaria bicolor S238N-H82]EDR01303.1 predicted protein [Laccaria bicolor S238N-H82]|eukprot:XP_001888010.1 predicted protein [Laccaria bicolor S238N-H82]